MSSDTTNLERARTGLTTNMLVLPGLGSLLLGRRAGWAQATVALTGLGLGVAWLARVVTLWVREGALPLWPRLELGLALAGVGLFVLAWTWALATALPAFRQARRNGTDTDQH